MLDIILRPLRAAAGAVALCVICAGCTGTQTQRLLETQSSDLPRVSRVADVPFFPQTEFHCGPAAMAMALTWSGVNTTPDSIAPMVYTPGREGTLAPDMITAARRQGRMAVKVAGLNNLLAEIAAGHPVIVFQNLGFTWYPRWHFAVATGYDLNTRQIILHSGKHQNQVTPLDTFENTWARTESWALVVLSPGQLPATAHPEQTLKAAVGLEQAQRPAEAVQAYAAIAAKWPENAPAALGEGNARYALNDYKGAESAYRESIRRDPQQADAWNNLAYALHKQGRRSDAIAAAQNAVTRATYNQALYADTLADVSRR